MDFALACDIMLDLEGSIRPALYLAEGLVEKGYTVSLISPLISEKVEKYLISREIKPVNLNAKLFARSFGLSVLWFEAWAREAFFKMNSTLIHNACVNVVNFSQVVSVPSLAWYLQGPPSMALKDMEKELPASFRTVHSFLKPFVGYADARLVRRMGKSSSLIVANSKFCASLYSVFGVKAHDIVYPPVDCQIFRPSTSNPSSDYVLTYFGKETKFSVIKKIADMGVKVKAFGSKLPFTRKEVINHFNIEFLGRVSIKELVDLYSNALFTLFPFTHEPFGYIPLESMACGTPPLTYNFQGPSEYIVDGQTGWLANNDAELIQKAEKLWKNGYPSRIRLQCANAASKFDKKNYIKKWLEILLG
ncbi:MAG: glycosyltransferase family 4 protein [Candidatus Bathyarchaeales archaeon]